MYSGLDINQRLLATDYLLGKTKTYVQCSLFELQSNIS